MSTQTTAPNSINDIPSTYWGWVKYRYHEEDKEKFEKAKQAVLKWLNACPDEVIRQFVNQVWRFVDAYQLGLSGKAAEWAVRIQKGHSCPSESTMRALEKCREA
jgi:hypothetical protein